MTKTIRRNAGQTCKNKIQQTLNNNPNTDIDDIKLIKIEKNKELNKQLRRIVTHNIKTFNNIHKNKFKSYKIEDIDYFVNKINKKEDSVLLNSISKLSLYDPNWKKTIHSILQDVFMFYNNNANQSNKNLLNNQLNNIIDKYYDKIKVIAKYINYNNIIDIIEKSIIYSIQLENDPLKIHLSNNSPTYNNWVSIVNNLNESSYSILLKIDYLFKKNDENDDIVLTFDDYIFYSIFLTASLIFRISNVFISPPFANILTSELADSNNEINYNRKLLLKVDNLVDKILKKYLSSLSYTTISNKRKETSVIPPEVSESNFNRYNTEIEDEFDDDETENKYFVNYNNNYITDSMDPNMMTGLMDPTTMTGQINTNLNNDNNNRPTISSQNVAMNKNKYINYKNNVQYQVDIDKETCKT